MQYIQEDYPAPNLSAGAIAKQFHISLIWLSNLFKRELYINFLDYLRRCRIKKAKDSILQTKYNISDIVEIVGYTNAVTMTRTFNRYEGIASSWYRQNPPVGQKEYHMNYIHTEVVHFQHKGEPMKPQNLFL